MAVEVLAPASGRAEAETARPAVAPSGSAILGLCIVKSRSFVLSTTCASGLEGEPKVNDTIDRPRLTNPEQS